MSKFSVNKDFDHAKADIGKTGDVLEIVRLDKTDLAIVIHKKNGCAEEHGVYTEEELRAIYWILST